MDRETANKHVLNDTADCRIIVGGFWDEEKKDHSRTLDLPVNNKQECAEAYKALGAMASHGPYPVYVRTSEGDFKSDWTFPDFCNTSEPCVARRY